MPTRFKRKPPKNAIVLGDVVFKLGVQEVWGTITGQQGMAVFVCEEEGLAIPLSFTPPLEAYGSQVSAFIRTYDRSLVLELGEDDVLLENIRAEKGELDVTDPEILSSLVEEQKLRRIPEALSGIATTMLTGIIALVLFLMGLEFFPFVMVPLCIALWGIPWSLSNYNHLSKSVVYDARCNWIDIESGRTSLNNGEFRYRMERNR